MLIGDWFVYQIPRVLHGPPRYIYVGCGRYSLLTSCHVVSVYSLRLHHQARSNAMWRMRGPGRPNAPQGPMPRTTPRMFPMWENGPLQERMQEQTAKFWKIQRHTPTILHATTALVPTPGIFGLTKNGSRQRGPRSRTTTRSYANDEKHRCNTARGWITFRIYRMPRYGMHEDNHST